jgi:hypothetical protein
MSRAAGAAGPVIPTRIVPSIRPARLSPEQVRREFHRLSAGGARVRVAGSARRQPARLLSDGYVPRYKLALFGRTFYLSDVRRNPDVQFFIAYIAGADGIHARLLYKDGSLLWRSASHFARSDHENWIGKGDTQIVVQDGEQWVYSAEHTTDLPLEMQTAVEQVSRRARVVRWDTAALGLVLRKSGVNRIGAYRDFTEPRRRARANPRNLIHGGRSVARFARPGDPGSLRFAAGFEPDFARGIAERSRSSSRLYGGRIARYRILSRNRRVQYVFFAGPHHVWIGYPQATTTELSSYGVRTVDVIVDEGLVVPGLEYHYLESEDPPVEVSQIPAGFVGPISSLDPWRADASAWLERLPVIREFRARVLADGPRRR